MTHAEPEANTLFQDLVPESIDAAAEAVVDLIVADKEEGEVETVHAGERQVRVGQPLR